jgi:hypothetical protein
MNLLNGGDHENLMTPVAIEARPIRQLVRAQDVARKLGVSVSWVVQHASGKRKPYLPAVKMGPGRSPLRFDPSDVERFIDDCRRLAGQRAGDSARDTLQINLDFSFESLRDFDELLNRYLPHYTCAARLVALGDAPEMEGEFPFPAEMWGSYIGEVLRRK